MPERARCPTPSVSHPQGNRTEDAPAPQRQHICCIYINMAAPSSMANAQRRARIASGPKGGSASWQRRPTIFEMMVLLTILVGDILRVVVGLDIVRYALCSMA